MLRHRIYVLPFLLMLLSACQNNPLRTAQTPEQYGDALYGIYVIANEQSAQLLKDATIPDDVKRPLAEFMVKSEKPATTLQNTVIAFGNGTGTVEQVQAAIAAAQPLINQLVAALVRVKPDAQPLADQLGELQ
jgi:hypothetical protein